VPGMRACASAGLGGSGSGLCSPAGDVGVETGGMITGAPDLSVTGVGEVILGLWPFAGPFSNAFSVLVIIEVIMFFMLSE